MIKDVIIDALRDATRLRCRLAERVDRVFDALDDAGAFWPAPDAPIRIDLIDNPGALAYVREIDPGVRLEYNGNGTPIAIEIDQ